MASQRTELLGILDSHTGVFTEKEVKEILSQVSLGGNGKWSNSEIGRRVYRYKGKPLVETQARFRHRCDTGHRYTPPCPTCSKDMIARINRKTKASFWGCDSFPECGGTRDLNWMEKLSEERHEQRKLEQDRKNKVQKEEQEEQEEQEKLRLTRPACGSCGQPMRILETDASRVWVCSAVGCSRTLPLNHREWRTFAQWDEQQDKRIAELAEEDFHNTIREGAGRILELINAGEQKQAVEETRRLGQFEARWKANNPEKGKEKKMVPVGRDAQGRFVAAMKETGEVAGSALLNAGKRKAASVVAREITMLTRKSLGEHWPPVLDTPAGQRVAQLVVPTLLLFGLKSYGATSPLTENAALACTYAIAGSAESVVEEVAEAALPLLGQLGAVGLALASGEESTDD